MDYTKWDAQADMDLDRVRPEEGDEEEGPCCNQFSCPCGNSNNFRGF